MPLSIEEKCNELIKLKELATQLSKTFANAPPTLPVKIQIARQWSVIFDKICLVRELDKKRISTTQSFDLITQLDPNKFYYIADANYALSQLKEDFGCLNATICGLQATETRKSLIKSLEYFHEMLVPAHQNAPVATMC